MKYITKDQMRSLERFAIEVKKIPALGLMERAGEAVAVEALKLVEAPSTIAIFAGYGNNGGDALVTARHLLRAGNAVQVFIVGKPKALTPETNTNLEALFSAGCRPIIIADEQALDEAFSRIGKPCLVIDGIFGTGMRGRLEPFYVRLIEKINALALPVIAIDIPSGLDADTGAVQSVSVKATCTVTFGYPKQGIQAPSAKDYVGALIVVDIGLPDIDALGAKTLAPHPGPVVSLRSGKMGRHGKRHPWIFKSQLRKTASPIKPGSIVTVTECDNSFVGRGYYNPHSDITVRLLTFINEPVDDAFLKERVREAVEKRKPILASTDAYRAISSEADNLPGIIVDVYAGTVVLQVLTLGMERCKDVIIEAIREYIHPKHIYEKSVSTFRKREGLEDLARWWGDPGQTLIEIHESGITYLVDIVSGHKTGFYLDQRKARLAIRPFAKGKRVLDLFCYTGGFSLSAAFAGAESVRGIDVKEEWLETARRASQMNGVSEKTTFERSDVFAALKAMAIAGDRYDVIIVDPPSFLRTRESLASAAKGYRQLNAAAMKVLSDGGLLATFSCSHNMPNELFFDMVKRASKDAGKSFKILKRCHQSEDHPIVRHIPQTEYLKGYFLTVNGA